MSSDKRLLLFVLLSASCFLAVQTLMVRTGLIKIPPPAARKAADAPAPGVAAKPSADAGPAMAGGLPADPFMPPGGIMPEGAPAARAVPAAPATPGEREIARARPDELVLGARDDADAASPYRLRLQLDQDDASVARATSTRFDAELDRRAKVAKPGRLTLIQPNAAAPDAPGSLAVFVAPAGRAEQLDDDDDAGPARKVEVPVSSWEVVRDRPDAPAVRALSKLDPATRKSTNGQELAFRARLADPAVELTKVFRIWEGEDGFEVDLKFNAPERNGKLTYRLVGPHGIPIEGEWYTTSYRDVFFGQVKPGGAAEVVTRTAYDAHKYAGDSAQRMSTLPLAFAGVEDQYFATFIAPATPPRDDAGRLEAAADSLVIHAKADDTAKADVTAVLESKPIAVGPNLGEVVHNYRVFVGPKTVAALAPYGAQDLASYRKTWIPIPFASSLATNVIAPLLGKIYWVTESLSRSFGGTKGNYGIAIILLTMTVRLIMFPIGRKQAMMAKKMQDLQPALAEIKERNKDDKEAVTRETMALWRDNKINPAAGCVPALIQMPIFVGLWQSLNNSVELRHSSFLYIEDLAAPDMAFRLPFSVPYIGEYINILPFLVVGLMLIQTKLFSPPPTTPEAEQQQKVMKYMMIFMAFMFYKVPSGLGLYFITSSLWQVGERLLLPKIMKTPKVLVEPPPSGGGRGPAGGPGRATAGDRNPKAPQGWLGKRLEKLMEEAAKDQTIRNANRDRPGPGGNGGGNGSSNGDGNRPRSKPPGKRR